METNPKLLSTLGSWQGKYKGPGKEYPGLEIKVLKNKDLGRSEIRFINGKRMFEADYRQVIKSIK